jgi:3-methylfumaryl-CoA hydratase
VTISNADIAAWRSWIGRSETRAEVLAPEPLRRFAAGVQEDLAIERTFPSLGHWAYFLAVAPTEALSADGHWRSGGLMPPVLLQRRMFAGATIVFRGPLQLNREAIRTSVVRDVMHKPGRSGDLVIVTLDHVIAQDNVALLEERQTFIFRPEGPPTPAVIPQADDAQAGDVVWRPDAVDLFRFSAATYNSHRIHYDLPYVTQVEGYPGLIVQGPYTAVKLFSRARRAGLKRFSFRATAPLFAGQPVRLRQVSESEFQAIRCDGATAMTATVEWT